MSSNAQSNANDTAFFATNIAYISELYYKYSKNPDFVSVDWQNFFKNNPEVTRDLEVDIANSTVSIAGNANEFSSIPGDEIAAQNAKKQKTIADIKLAIKDKSIAGEVSKMLGASAAQSSASSVAVDPNFQAYITAYIEDLYIKYSHKEVQLDPLGLKTSVKHPVLQSVRANYPQITAGFDAIYTKATAADFSYIQSVEEYNWLKQKFTQYQHQELSKAERLAILGDIINAEMFENQIHLKFPGAKRFSVEGGEAMLPALEEILSISIKNGVKEAVIGMAHRGRLNVLTNTMGKPQKAIFAEFAGGDYLPDDFCGSGDVKYHNGYSNDRNVRDAGSIHLTLTPNPSHLEAVNPVVAGRVRAKQDANGDTKTRRSVLPILIHGDAAMAGQGIVYECFAMANIDGYYVGGTIHISIDNQVGFTASNKHARGLENYSTDVAKVISAPVFHINCQDVDSVIKMARLAAEYRATFGKDVVLDLICYRKYGHNEGDEPMFTQPVMYNVIKNRQNPHQLYAQELIKKGVITNDEYENLKSKTKKMLDDAFESSKTYKKSKLDWLDGVWSGIKPVKDGYEICNFADTKISKSVFDKVGKVLCEVQKDGFNVNKKVQKVLDDRKTMISTGNNIDWAAAELLAYASLLTEGYSTRLTGEDCERGTFSHRHSVLYDQDNNSQYNLLSPLCSEKVKYEVHNSLLSEFAVLGYEYGYSLSAPQTLTIWEAQFGDFSNGAVTIYDQFISSGEDKWHRLSGLVNLLPHGFEGQGPEHSSARLERFLQYCAQNNIIVANLTTPANLFHALRRQVKSSFRKPLIIMSPKSLLRHPSVKSTVDDFTKTSFKTIIDAENIDAKSRDKITNIVVTSGKFYYELLAKQQEANLQNTAIIRVEQYYPFDAKLFAGILSSYKNAINFTWAQEEPKNMGAWSFIRDYLQDALTELKSKSQFVCVARPASPSPASGYLKIHNKEQEKLIKTALGL